MVNRDLLLAIVPKVGATISIPSSLFIISEALTDHFKGKGTAIQRALVGMSIVDVCASFAWFLSTWAVPKGTAPLSRGNVATCSFQGFLLQLAIGAPLYNCSLALYYLLVIKYNWTNAQLVRIERYVHLFIISFTVGTSIAGLPLTMYNKVGTVCWVIGSPTDCGNSSNTTSDIPCDRGDWAWVFGIALFYGPLWICVFLTIIAMTMIYVQVRRTFKRNDIYQFRGRSYRRSVFSPNAQNFEQTNFEDITIRTQADSGAGPATATSTDAAGRIGNQSRTKSSSNENQGHHPDDPENEAVDELEVIPPRSTRDQSRLCEESGGIGLKRAWINAKESQDSRNTNPPSQLPAPLRSSPSVTPAQRKQKLFATQAILYSASFFITWAPSTIWSVSSWFGVLGFGFDIAAATSEPLQGFWNMLIFIRSRESSQKKLQKIFGTWCCFWVRMLPVMNDTSRHSVSRHSSHAADARTSTQQATMGGDKSRLSASSAKSQGVSEQSEGQNQVDEGVAQVETDNSVSESST